MNNQQPSYSLIIPHFNDTIRLERLLRSVPVERADLEVIVVDDCSTEQNILVIVQARWPSVRWLSTQENSGAGAARNVGLDAAMGSWLVFADSDDEFLPAAFEQFDQVLREDDQLVYFLAEAVQEADGSPSVRAEGMNALVEAFAAGGDQTTQQRLRLHHVVPWAKVYSRDFIEAKKLRFDAVRHGNDVAFNVLCGIQANKIHAFPNPVYRVYRRPQSLTANLSAEVFMQRFLVSVSVAERLATLGYKRIWPGTGQMLMSLRYGPRLTLKVWWLVFRSPMKIDIFRALDIKRWWGFIHKKIKTKSELVG